MPSEAAKPEPKKGLEVDLKEMGCPYPPLDPRTGVWLDGYKVGIEAGKDITMQCFDEAFGK